MTDAPKPVGWRLGRGRRADVSATERIEIRVTPEERIAWADASGDLSLSEWIRERCNRAASRAKP